MKENKLMFGLVFFIVVMISLLSSQSVLGVDTTGTQMYMNAFSGNSTESLALYDWSGNGNNGTNVGATLTNETWDMNANGEKISYSDFITTGADVDLTLNTWFSPNDVSGGAFAKPVLSQINGYRNGDFTFYYYVDMVKFARYIGSSNTAEIFRSSFSIDEGIDQHWVTVYHASNSTVTFYKNNVSENVGISTTDAVTIGDGIGFGSTGVAIWYLDAEVYQGQVLNNAVNHTWVSDTNAEGRFYNPYTAPAEDTNFTITLKDAYSNTLLNNFTAYVGSNVFSDNGTGLITTNITNGNGSVFDILIIQDDYFYPYYENYNVSTNLEAIANGTNVTFRIVLNGTNETADVSNTNLWDLNNSINLVSSNGYFNSNPTPLTPITFKVFCNRSVFENKTFELTFDARDEKEYVIYVEPTVNYFTFFDADTNLTIDNASVLITYPNGDIQTKYTNSSGVLNFSWINSSNEIDLGVYNFTFNKIGYNIITFSETLNETNIPYNKEFNISRSNLIINIYDRSTGSRLSSVNVTLKLLGIFENSTTSGIFNYSDLSLISKSYTLQALANGYDTEQRSFDYSNQEDLEIDFYLLNTSLSNAGTLFVTNVDESYFRLQNVQDILQENIFGEWVSVSECYSNSNGECVFSVELGTKLYKVIGYKYIGGVLVTDQTSEFGEFIEVDADVRTLVLSAYEDFETIDSNKLIYNIDYTAAYELEVANNISTVSVDFYKFDGTSITLCVQYYLLNGSTKQNATTETCNTATSGSVNLGKSYLIDRSNDYSVEVYIKNGQTLLTEVYPKVDAFRATLKDLGLVVILGSTIFLMLLGIAIKTGNIGIFLFGSIALSWIYLGVIPDYWSGYASMVITIVCGTAFFIIKDKVIKE